MVMFEGGGDIWYLQPYMLQCKSLESGWDWFSQCAGYGRVTVTVNMRTLTKLKAKLRGY